MSCREGHLFSDSLHKLFYHFATVTVDHDGTVLNLARTAGFAVVQAGVNGVFVVIGHLPERVLDDHRCVGSDADLQEQHMLPFMLFQEVQIRC